MILEIKHAKEKRNVQKKNVDRFHVVFVNMKGKWAEESKYKAKRKKYMKVISK